jgi:hypothetical protein
MSNINSRKQAKLDLAYMKSRAQWESSGAKAKLIAEAEALYEEHRKTLELEYGDLVISGVDNPTKMAPYLSRVYPTLRVNISYENGMCNITATLRPWKCQFDDEVNIRTMMLEKNVKTNWPHLNEVRARAHGYEAGFAEHRDAVKYVSQTDCTCCGRIR